MYQSLLAIIYQATYAHNHLRFFHKCSLWLRFLKQRFALYWDYECVVQENLLPWLSYLQVESHQAKSLQNLFCLLLFLRLWVCFFYLVWNLLGHQWINLKILKWEFFITWDSYINTYAIISCNAWVQSIDTIPRIWIEQDKCDTSILKNKFLAVASCSQKLSKKRSSNSSSTIFSHTPFLAIQSSFSWLKAISLMSLINIYQAFPKGFQVFLNA